MPVCECLRTRYAPVSSNTEELERLLASSLLEVAESLSLSEVQMSTDKIRHLTAFVADAGSSDRVLDNIRRQHMRTTANMREGNVTPEGAGSSPVGHPTICR
jgi:hypothetical protein